MTDAIEPVNLDEKEDRQEESEGAVKKSFQLLSALRWADITQLVNEETLQKAIDETPGGPGRVVSFAVRVAPKAGGYLFQFKLESQSLVLLTYRNRMAYRFASLCELASFINHCTGLKYDKKQYDIAQLINVQSEVAEEVAEALE